MQVTESRPPYVRFAMHDVEDRDASIKAGHYVGREVPFAHITPQGSKDVIERNAEEWLADLSRQVVDGRMPQAWVDQFRAAYNAWLRDEEPPMNGVPLRTWPVISPGQYKTLRDLRILTVEDLANMNEESISRFGMGARALKDKAIEWLKSAKGTGTSVEEVAALKEQNRQLSETVARMAQQMETLASALKGAGIPVPNAPVEVDKGLVSL